ncbi:MFS transporter [Longispora urticae]
MIRSWRVPVLVAGHAVNDLYQGAVPALVPFWITQRHYGYVAAAGVALAAAVLSSLAQPVFGWLTDRRPLPALVPAGMTLAGLGIACSGLGESYAWTWTAVALSGLGVAAYHPESARLARLATRGSHVGMSWFSLGGTVGFALAPLAVTPVVAGAGLPGTVWLGIPAVLCALVTVACLRGVGAAPAGGPTRGPGGTGDWGSFLRLSALVVCRSVVVFGLSTFLAVHVQQRVHGGPAAGAVALVVLFGAGALGTLLGGRLADRYGRVRVVRPAYAATVVALAGVACTPGPAVYLFVAAVGVCAYVPFSLHVTLGQDYLPHRVGTASGLTLGLAVSVGGLTAPVLGAMAQAWSLPTALATLTILPALAWALSRRLPEPRPMAFATTSRELQR